MSSPITTLVNLYSTLNMEFDIVAADTLYNHTRITKDPMLGVNKSKYYSTYRTSDNDIYKWKNQLRIEEIRHVEENCVEFMEKVGFNVFKPTVKKQIPRYSQPSTVKQQKVTSIANTAFKTIYEAHQAEVQDIKRTS